MKNQTAKSAKTITGKNFSNPYHVGSEVITDSKLVAVAEPFHLLHADYVYLTNSHSAWSEWAIRFVVGSGMLATQTLWKQLKAGAFQVTDYGESVLILVVALVLFGIGKRFPTERDRVQKDMKNHFANASTKFEVRR